MTLTAATFRAAFPANDDGEGGHFAGIPDLRITRILDRYVRKLSVDVYDTEWEDAVYLYTAHFLTLEKRAVKSGAGGVGAVTSSTAQRNGTGYATPQVRTDEGSLASTRFGLEIIDIERGLVLLPGVA